MDDTQYKPRRKWPLILGLVVVALVVLWFVVTSGAFLRAVVLPRVAASLHSELTVEDISLRPFSALTLRKLKLTPTGAETLATVEEVRLRYSLFAILGGTIKVNEVTVDTPVITVVGRPDDSSNLQTLLDAMAKEKKAPEPSTPGEPEKLDIHNVTVKNGTVRQTTVSAAGPTTVELTGIRFTLDQLANGAPGKVTLGALAGLTANATNQISARADGAFAFVLDSKLQPTQGNGTFDLGVTAASGAFRDFGKVAVKLAADAAPTELKQFRLAISEAGRPVGELSVSGPFDVEKKEARLAYELKGIDRNALGIVGAMAGVDFGQTTISAAGRVDLAQRGQIFASFGQVSVNQLSLKSAAGTTPVLDSAFDYKLQVNLEDKTALVEKADLNVKQGGTALVQGGLDRPMNIAWDAAAPGFREATYKLSVKQLDLASWRSVGGTSLPTGRVNLDASVTSERDGRRLKFTADAVLDQVELPVAGRNVRDLGLTLKTSGSVEDFKVFTVEQAAGEARYAGELLAKFSGLVSHNQRSGEINGQATTEVQLPTALKLYPVESVNLSGGVAQASAQVGTKAGATNTTIAFNLTGLTGQAFGATLRDYQAQLDASVTLTSTKLSLRRGSLSLRSGTDPAGSLDLTGEYDVPSERGTFAFKTLNLNEKVVGPFLAPAMAPNELRSVSLDLSGSAQVDLKGESALKSALKVSRLVARDPAGKLPQQPLAFGMDLDAAQRGQTVDLRKLTLDLGATSKAANQLHATGKFDLATNNPAPSSLMLTSDGLDFTTLYDLFSGDTRTTVRDGPVAAPPAGKAGEPIQFPLEQFTLDAKIAAILLREIAVSNFVAKVALNHGKVVVNPFSLTLNGAPVSARADLDLSVPGYRYDLAADLQTVPVPPLARSLLKGELVELKGTLNGKMKLAGAGVEGADLRQHLNGNFEFAATNLDHQISALQTPLMKRLVASLTLALQIPDIAESPIEGMAARLVAGQGTVKLESARVASAAFQADADGQIQLADILTNSPINLPITVSLPQEGKMEALPQFLTMKGTLGAPKPDINPLALAQAATRLPGGAGSLVNKGVGQLGGALDKVLGGKGSTNPGPGTSLLQGLLGTPKTNTTTNTAPGAATNAPAKPFNPLDLFKKSK